MKDKFDKKNTAVRRFSRLSHLFNCQRPVFGGRLGLYRYFDMDKVIRQALNCAAGELQ
jgi:UDP-galactopyranose mutase